MSKTAQESWLERRIRNYYGQRCPDFAKDCACCDAWSLYDKIIKDNSLKGDFKQTYDKKTDAAYIYINRIEPKKGIVAKTLELSDYVNLDFDKDKRLIGIEVIVASKHMPKVFAEISKI